MELDLIWILVGLPAAFGLGWLASRLDLRAVQNDPDTSELHFALGNLFRRRGEYERAVRVHEHLLSRGDLSTADRQRAQNALAKDFVKAGLLDRAEDALRKLEGTAFEGQARLARLAIYERSREWPQARQVAEQLEGSGEVSFSVRKAHYLCEQARELNAQGDSAGASQLLLNAIQEAPEAPRPRLLLGQLQLNMNQATLACDTLSQLFESSSVAAPLAAPSLVMAAQTSQRVPQTLALLKSHYEQSPCIDVMDAIVSLEKTSADSEAHTRQRYIEHLQKQPSLLAASRWLAGADLGGDETRGPVQKALEQASRPLSRYRCAACGFEAKEHFWHCPGCQAWDSYPPRRVEEL